MSTHVLFPPVVPIREGRVCMREDTHGWPAHFKAPPQPSSDRNAATHCEMRSFEKTAFSRSCTTAGAASVRSRNRDEIILSSVGVAARRDFTRTPRWDGGFDGAAYNP